MSASLSLSSFAPSGGSRIADPQRDFEELLKFLKCRDAKAVIVGAHALAYHAKPRYTKDLDILLEATSENAKRVLAALADFGFGDVDLSIEDFTTPGRVVQLGFPPNRIDLMTSIDGVAFSEVWAGRVEGMYGGNKKASGRPHDLADLDWLTKS